MKPVALIILDGWGLSEGERGNAIKCAKLPFMTQIMKECPWTTLACSGTAVGLPEGQMGNSEVGHLNIGAGRVVYQEFSRISRSIEQGDFFVNPAFKEVIDGVKKRKSTLHLMGLVSDGGVHSHIEHLVGLLRLAKQEGLNKVYVHAFLDGRDVAPRSAALFLEKLQTAMKEIGVGQIASLQGRYYAMDRDQRWERVEKGYQALVDGVGRQAYEPLKALEQAYDMGENDEFVLPTVIFDGEQPVGRVGSEDGLIFFNFRPDRARQITRAFVDQGFSNFNRSFRLMPDQFVCMTQYDAAIDARIAFPPHLLQNTLGEVVAHKGLKQLRIAETEKYAHVTFFFNGGQETPFDGEERLLVPSPKVATYDLQPEMSADLVAESVIQKMRESNYDLVVMNFANADMVGHTGVMDAAVKAVETVDLCLAKVVPTFLEHGRTVMITADHGNAEEMLTPEGKAVTKHTCNKVPFIYVSEHEEILLRSGILADIAPTLLDVMGIEKPEEMTGTSLIVK